jgi:hypothetical protein
MFIKIKHSSVFYIVVFVLFVCAFVPNVSGLSILDCTFQSRIDTLETLARFGKQVQKHITTQEN